MTLKLVFQKYIILLLFRILLPIWDTYGDIYLAIQLIQVGFIISGCIVIVPVILSTSFLIIVAVYDERVEKLSFLEWILIIFQLYVPYQAIKIMLTGDSEWENKKQDMDLSASLIEPIIEAIPQLIILSSITLYILALDNGTSIDILFQSKILEYNFDGATLLGIKLLLSLFSSVWGLFRVFRDGPCSIPIGFRIGMIFFSLSNIWFPISVSLTYLAALASQGISTRDEKVDPELALILRPFQILTLLLHGPLWTVYCLKRHLSWSNTARVILR